MDEEKNIENIENNAEKPAKHMFPKRNYNKHSSFESANKIEKISLNVVIVNEGIGDAVIALMKHLGASASYVHIARGTATKEILEVLGISNTQKEVVCSFVRESSLKEIQKELDAFFVSSKKNAGISFSTPLSSIEGVRLYKFLSQTL